MQDRILVVIGSSPSVVQDYNALTSFLGEDLFDYLIVGLSSAKIWRGKVDYVATYHPYDIKFIIRELKFKDYKIISHVLEYPLQGIQKGVVDLVVPYTPPSGSSALLGVFAGIQMGYKKIVLCGCPLEGRNAKNYSYETFRVGWETSYSEIKSFTKSMSGWTSELLGKPSISWLLFKGD